MIGIAVKILNSIRCIFWRTALRYLGGELGRGTKIFEGVKISATHNSPVFIGENCSLQKGAVISSSATGRITIADRVYVGEYVVICSRGEIVIGADVLIAPQTYIGDFDHVTTDLQKPIDQQGVDCSKVVLGKNVWIGAGCKILKGVTIGEGSVIGAGSVVNRDVPPFSVCVGVPARVIRSRDPERTPEEEVTQDA